MHSYCLGHLWPIKLLTNYLLRMLLTKMTMGIIIIIFYCRYIFFWYIQPSLNFKLTSYVLYYSLCINYKLIASISLMWYHTPVWYASDLAAQVLWCVERCHGGLCLYPDCLLHTVTCSSWVIDLAMHVSGEFSRGLVVTGTTVFIGLLWPPGTFCHNILACLGQLTKLGDS